MLFWWRVTQAAVMSESRSFGPRNHMLHVCLTAPYCKEALRWCLQSCQDIKVEQERNIMSLDLKRTISDFLIHGHLSSVKARAFLLTLQLPFKMVWKKQWWAISVFAKMFLKIELMHKLQRRDREAQPEVTNLPGLVRPM